MFKVGDRVRYTGDFTPYLIGLQGIVKSVQDDGETAYVAFVGGRRPEEGVLVENIELVQAAPVIDTGDGDATKFDIKRGPLPEDSAERKEYPLYRGLFAYFPSALAAVAKHSKEGNDKHNPGQDMHHARGKSSDHRDALLRHVMEDDLVGAAWRALALLQEDLEAKGAPLAPGARLPADGTE